MRRHKYLPALIVFASLFVSPSSLGISQQPAMTVKIAVPDPYKLDMLIRSALIALHHANQTGNYTVFRDLGAPEFQNTNSPADLGVVFAKLRDQKLDLLPIIIATPKATHHPRIDERGLLRLTGYFPTEPLRVNFDLSYRNVAGEWRLFGILVEATPALPPVAQAPPAPLDKHTVATKTKSDLKID